MNRTARVTPKTGIGLGHEENWATKKIAGGRRAGNASELRNWSTGLCRVRFGGAGRLAEVRNLARRLAGDRARQLHAFLPDGRPQTARRDRSRDGGRRALLRLGG